VPSFAVCVVLVIVLFSVVTPVTSFAGDELNLAPAERAVRAGQLTCALARLSSSALRRARMASAHA